ncbi:MAG TPA: hypothetical protein PKK43_08885 [Spirochaetota bacterium]|nr:hypothetical protein [Spirochaetota bacterium]
MKKIASIMAASTIMITMMIIIARADITVTTFHEPGKTVKSQSAADTGVKSSSSRNSAPQNSRETVRPTQQEQQNEGRYIPSANGEGDPK